MRTLSEISQLPDEALIDRAEAAALLNLDPATVARMERDEPDFPKSIRLSSAVRYRLGALRQWIAGRPSEPLPEHLERMKRARAARKPPNKKAKP